MTLLTKWKKREALPSIWDADFFDFDAKPLASLTKLLREGFPGDEMGATDVYEQNGNVVTETNLAGFKPEDVDIEVESDCVKISASFSDEKSEDKSDKDRKYYKKEIVQRSFSRILPLPSSVKEKEAKAEYIDGILKITIPKNVQKETVKLKIKK